MRTRAEHMQRQVRDFFSQFPKESISLADLIDIDGSDFRQMLRDAVQEEIDDDQINPFGPNYAG